MTRLWLSALLLQGCFYISEAERSARWDLDGDGVERPWDCDDDDPAVQTFVWYVDEDGDGYGDPSRPIESCEQPEGAVANGDDCDDTDPAVNPGATEVCNGIDDNCDGRIDEGVEPGTWFEDGDGDGYGNPDVAVTACEPPPGFVDNGDDCDDTDPAVNPGATEVCDGVDNNCDGKVDLEDPALDPADYTWHLDEDGDGWGDEAKASVTACEPPPGYGPPGDCDDTRDDVHPDADEVCDGVDNNCNGVTDGIGAVDGQVWFRDGDGDGYGDPTQQVTACTEPPGYVAIGQDCDDDDPDIHPAATEYCNGIDNTCNTFVDCACACTEPVLPEECECVPTDTGS